MAPGKGGLFPLQPLPAAKPQMAYFEITPTDPHRNVLCSVYLAQLSQELQQSDRIKFSPRYQHPLCRQPKVG